jgi:predicted TIM-barrel fold metal-dependent hydrolase
MATPIESFLTYDPAAAMPDRRRTVTFLPEPEKRRRLHTIISVDDHLVEPPDTFEGRVARKYADRAPKVISTPNGGQAWLYDNKVLPNVGFNAVVGRPLEEVATDAEPTRFADMRRGTWDVHARIHDMDLNGIYASLNFPSFLAGFGGGRLQTIVSDRDLALATLRAYNEWHLEGWCGAYPDRLISNQIPWLHDPELGAREIERNAARGFRAVTFPETPHELGFPSVHNEYWDPMMRACAETGTVLCLHTGSGGMLPSTAPDAPGDVRGILFGLWCMTTAADWLYSGWPGRYPDLKICLSEGGIGWVPGVIDRLQGRVRQGDVNGTWSSWGGADPGEILRRNFWFCFLDDRTSLKSIDDIGVERVMFEVDYPHADTSWPDSQVFVHEQIRDLPSATQRRLTWQNAAQLFRHPVPAAVQADPNAF